MAKAANKKESKPRASEYEQKVSFDGTFEQMIGISVKDAEKKVAEKKVDKMSDYYYFSFDVIRGHRLVKSVEQYVEVPQGSTVDTNKIVEREVAQIKHPEEEDNYTATGKSLKRITKEEYEAAII